MYGKILIALDGSEPANNALEHAIRIATAFGAELRLLAVVPGMMLSVLSEEVDDSLIAPRAQDLVSSQERLRSVYGQILEDAASKLKSEHPDLVFGTLLREGRPSVTIIEVAEEEDVDLVILGSEGLGGITGYLLGGTSRRVMDSCTKPVLIVK